MCESETHFFSRMARMKQIYVAECNWFPKEPRKAQIREICDICERIKTYLVILAHGLHSTQILMLPTATSRLTKSRAILIAVNFLSSQNCFFIPAKGSLREP